MVQQYTVQLDGKPGSPRKKYDCPQCGHKKRFRRYYNYEAGEYLADDCGLCDRPRCGYHLTPKEHYARTAARPIYTPTRPVQITAPKTIHLPGSVLKDTLGNYWGNSFIKPLLAYFPAHKVEGVIAEYFIGTVQGAFKAEEAAHHPAVFWFIDQHRNIRAGQIKLFNEQCSTVKYTLPDGEVRPCTTWIHSYLKKQSQKEGTPAPEWLAEYADSDKVTCFFGEHLLSKYRSKPVALVEAPKTAVIASLVFPDYLWMATGSLSYLTKERCRVLAGRKVVVFPDSGIPNPKTGKTCKDLWAERIEEFSHLADFHISTLLEEKATAEEKEKAFDLADYLLRELKKQPVSIPPEAIAGVPVEVRTGPEFGRLILATILLVDGRRYDVLYDSQGELITAHEKIQPLAEYFNKSFIPGTLCGADCLLNTVTY